MAARALPELASPLAELPAGPSHYERLGVALDASTEQVRAAYQAWLAAQAPAAGADGAVPADPTAPAHPEAPAMHLAHAVLSDPMRRQVYDAFLLSHRRVHARAGRWWRRPAARRRLAATATVLIMLGAVGAVAWLVWRLY